MFSRDPFNRLASLNNVQGVTRKRVRVVLSGGGCEEERREEQRGWGDKGAWVCLNLCEMRDEKSIQTETGSISWCQGIRLTGEWEGSKGISFPDCVFFYPFDWGGGGRKNWTYRLIVLVLLLHPSRLVVSLDANASLLPLSLSLSVSHVISWIQAYIHYSTWMLYRVKIWATE